MSANAAVAIIIQARVSSTRLPGKIFLPLEGQPVLGYLLTNLRPFSHPIIIATTTLPQDDVVEDFARQYRVPCVRGSSEDVLSRYALAAQLFSSQTIIRLTSDCPLHDVSLIENALCLYQKKSVHYLSNTILRTFPRGYDIEIFSNKALMVAAEKAKTFFDREHVTPYIIRTFSEGAASHFVDDEDLHSWRLTLDTEEDYCLLKKVAHAVSADRSYTSVKKILKTYPEWKKINEHILQKT